MNEGALVSKGVRQRKHVILKLTKKLEVFIDASDSLGCQKSVVFCISWTICLLLTVGTTEQMSIESCFKKELTEIKFEKCDLLCVVSILMMTMMMMNSQCFSSYSPL